MTRATSSSAGRNSLALISAVLGQGYALAQDGRRQGPPARHAITLNNNVLNLADDDRRRPIEELQQKVFTNAKSGDES